MQVNSPEWGLRNSGFQLSARRAEPSLLSPQVTFPKASAPAAMLRCCNDGLRADDIRYDTKGLPLNSPCQFPGFRKLHPGLFTCVPVGAEELAIRHETISLQSIATSPRRRHHLL